ncbi:MAG: hypothetical protein M1814_005385 [Vezdaea aestivalis]|nr:MAG: hypothetical protein M1814_005385 [Vezdaea aestivalis]
MSKPPLRTEDRVSDTLSPMCNPQYVEVYRARRIEAYNLQALAIQAYFTPPLEFFPGQDGLNDGHYFDTVEGFVNDYERQSPTADPFKPRVSDYLPPKANPRIVDIDAWRTVNAKALESPSASAGDLFKLYRELRVFDKSKPSRDHDNNVAKLEEPSSLTPERTLASETLDCSPVSKFGLSSVGSSPPKPSTPITMPSLAEFPVSITNERTYSPDAAPISRHPVVDLGDIFSSPSRDVPSSALLYDCFLTCYKPSIFPSVPAQTTLFTTDQTLLEPLSDLTKLKSPPNAYLGSALSFNSTHSGLPFLHKGQPATSQDRDLTQSFARKLDFCDPTDPTLEPTPTRRPRNRRVSPMESLRVVSDLVSTPRGTQQTLVLPSSEGPMNTTVKKLTEKPTNRLLTFKRSADEGVKVLTIGEENSSPFVSEEQDSASHTSDFTYRLLTLSRTKASLQLLSTASPELPPVVSPTRATKRLKATGPIFVHPDGSDSGSSESGTEADEEDNVDDLLSPTPLSGNRKRKRGTNYAGREN